MAPAGQVHQRHRPAVDAPGGPRAVPAHRAGRGLDRRLPPAGGGGPAGAPGPVADAVRPLPIAARPRPLLRESLKRDWEGGLKFLEFHRDYLRGEIAVSRRRTRLQRLSRAGRAWLNEKPSVALVVLLGLLAAGIAAWRYALWGN
ncbi:MAG: hypothetical protein U0797_17420 [Gemmataceae bacterium]